MAIGNFDGVHRGHRAVVEAAAAMAASTGGALGVVTFEPHPREVVSPGESVPRLTGFARKALLLGELGVAELFVLPFGPALMQLSPEAFVRAVLLDRLAISGLAAGENFRFGHRRRGDILTLGELGRELGFAFTGVPAVRDRGPVSSSRIRMLLGDGDVAAAASLLGHPHVVDGIVRPGDRRGRLLGFPTANVHALDPRLVLPAIGVYAVRVMRRGARGACWLPGVANLGRRPTFDGEALLLEVHLLEGGGDLYGERLCVAFVDRLRGEQKFAGIDELKAQIGRDCRSALDRLAA